MSAAPISKMRFPLVDRRKEPYYPLAVTNVGPQVIVTVPAGTLNHTLNLAEAGALHTALTISLRLAEVVVVEAARGKHGR